MSYELTLDLHGARLEIEADGVDDLESKVRALDVTRLESLIAEKRVAVASSVAPAEAPPKKATKKTGTKRTRKAGKKAGAKRTRKSGKKKGTRTSTGAE